MRKIFWQNDIIALVWGFHDALDQCGIKKENYRHQLQEVSVNNRFKRALGRASAKNAGAPGKIEISGCFVGLEKTDENFDQLADTILHELAHLYAGILEGHNETWQTVAKRMGAKPQKDTKITGELEKALRPPWVLVATMESGKRIKVKEAYKCSSKYLNRLRKYSIQGEPVERFEWVRAC